MKIIIAGSRGLTNRDNLVATAMGIFGHVPNEVFHGASGKIDIAGNSWALYRKIHVKAFPADSQTYGKRAGPIRNETMAGRASALVAIWDGKSRGTWNMIQLADKQEIEILVITVDVGEVKE